MDELDLQFLKDVCSMRIEVALERQSKEEVEKEEQDYNKQEELYKKVVENCTEEAKKVLLEYLDELADKQNNDSEFYYKAGFEDAIRLMRILVGIK